MSIFAADKCITYLLVLGVGAVMHLHLFFIVFLAEKLATLPELATLWQPKETISPVNQGLTGRYL